MTIGERIKTRRQELGLTQEDLANRMGYKSKSTINKIEMGINDITQSKIELFAAALNTTPAHLMGWKDDLPQPPPLPDHEFDDPEEAVKFILEQPAIMAYGGYDLETMSDEEIIDMANDVLYVVKLSTERHKRKK